jgi:2-dehydro-3-deoxyphosphogluconate aldolase/(4S)-4-hydroxy-2-oxoglutarate aldolase
MTAEFDMPPSDPLPLIAGASVIPVLTIERAADAVPLARALVAGGLPVLEVTLRTDAALAAIALIAEQVREAVVGVGTVTAPDDIGPALRSGAQYLVSPGTPGELAAAFAQAPVPAIPGCATVSEAMMLFAHGFSVLKFFPAEASGGTAWLKAVAAPLPTLRFCPTGGVNGKNAAAYLGLPNVAAVGGSWVAPKDAIAAGDFSRITALARAAAGLRRQQK